MTSKSTKRALLSSAVALLVCFTMLLGTTFAWFTDSATSANNKINAGTLDVQLFQWTAADAKTEITYESAPLFSGDMIWEPGKTEVVYLSIRNNGNLALKYRVALDVTSVSTHKLTDVMEYDIQENVTYGNATPWEAGNGTAVVPGTNATQADSVTLLPGEEHTFALSVHMLETATNEYMGESITFDIRVLAGQLNYEVDSFGPDYDKLAEFPGEGYSAPIQQGQSAAEIRIVGDDGYKVGSVVIPAAAAAQGAALSAKVTKSYYEGNFTVAAGLETTKYDVTVEGLVDNNTEPVKVQLRIPAGLDPATVSLYHYDNQIACDYNPNTGYVTFETATFSPFTVVYDAESEYVAPAVPENPQTTLSAKVTYLGVNAGEGTIAWGNYGQWSPTEGLEANLEGSFKFECPADLGEYEAYRYWYCDFYVSLNTELGANEIFLGGNYGDFGWVGFHNGDLTLAANEEIALLGSVTSNPWTYDDVENYVGTFICGVGDVNNALEGATFTVTLRLTNPDNEADFVNVNVVTYTFGGENTEGTYNIQ